MLYKSFPEHLRLLQTAVAIMFAKILIIKGLTPISYMSDKPSKIYYSSQYYWRGIAVIKNLSTNAKVRESIANPWLKRQAI